MSGSHGFSDEDGWRDGPQAWARVKVTPDGVLYACTRCRRVRLGLGRLEDNHDETCIVYKHEADRVAAQRHVPFDTTPQWFYRRLSAEEHQAVSQHLFSCEECMRNVETWRKNTWRCDVQEQNKEHRFSTELIAEDLECLLSGRHLRPRAEWFELTAEDLGPRQLLALVLRVLRTARFAGFERCWTRCPSCAGVWAHDVEPGKAAPLRCPACSAQADCSVISTEEAMMSLVVSLLGAPNMRVLAGLE